MRIKDGQELSWSAAQGWPEETMALLVMNDTKKYPDFAGNVKCVDSRDFWREAAVSPRDQGFHYNRNAETYMEVGLLLGNAMADLLKK